MFLDFYGFEYPPFEMTPDTRFIYSHGQYEEAMTALSYGVEGGRGFVVITGEVGSGKTTLLRAFLSYIRERAETAVILNTALDPRGLLVSIAEDFGISLPREAGIKEAVDSINSFLLESHSRGREVVILIDEAQNLPVESLEAVRMLSNLETESAKLLQIVLFGQPELRRTLSREDMVQLRQRVAVTYHLKALSRKDTAGYIRHRLSVAAPRRPVRFDEGAVRLLHSYSRGVPRIINVVADQALVAGAAVERDVVGREIVKGVIRSFRDLDEGNPGAKEGGFHSLRAKIGPLLPVAAVFVIGILFLYLASGRIDGGNAENHTTIASGSRSDGVAGDGATPRAGRTASLAEPTFASIVERAGGPGEADEDLLIADPFAAAASLGLSAVEIRLSLDNAARLGLPFILPPQRPFSLEEPSLLYFAPDGSAMLYLRRRNQRIALPPGLISRPLRLISILPARPWTGSYLNTGDEGEAVEALQAALKRLGLLTREPTGRFGRETREAVRSLQERYGIRTDGIVGPETATALFAAGA